MSSDGTCRHSKFMRSSHIIKYKLDLIIIFSVVLIIFFSLDPPLLLPFSRYRSEEARSPLAIHSLSRWGTGKEWSKTKWNQCNKSGDNSVGTASCWRSEGRVFDPRSPQLWFSIYFSLFSFCFAIFLHFSPSAFLQIRPWACFLFLFLARRE